MKPKEARELARKLRKSKDKTIKPKYGNKKTTSNGIEFDSKAEAKRYAELLLLERAGHISDIELQPRYLLQESFKIDGKTHRSINYTPDFRYMKDGEIIVEEVKGFADTSYKIRKKLFLFKYRDLTFIELNL